MNMAYSLLAVVFMIALAWIGAAAGAQVVFGVLIPYAAIAVFILGIIYRVVRWGKSPVPFRIPTTCGQQKSLPWIKHSKLESPCCTLGVVGRMALEVLCFRSLFRNSKAGLKNGQRLVYGADKWLWLGGLLFHWSFLVIFLRHFRFFAEPVPFFVQLLQNLDGFFQIGAPVFLITDATFVIAITYLFLRRVVIPQVRYISLPADFFPLFLILGIAVTGILMRYFIKVDIIQVKELGMGLLSLRPTASGEIGAIFYIHFFLVSALIAYFPFSKLTHMAGVFLSPTRNLANNNRAVRHINPWNYPVKVHSYEEYEDEFRDVMKEAGLPLDKE